jgi:hypothetical protein
MLDISGPAEAADLAADALDAEAAELRRIADVVDSRWAYHEPLGFQDAVEACGEAAQWTELGEVPDPGLVYGNDEASIRLPAHVQAAYGEGLAAALFVRFAVCTRIGMPDDDDAGAPARYVFHHLFGFIDREDTPTAAMFEIASWKQP